MDDMDNQLPDLRWTPDRTTADLDVIGLNIWLQRRLLGLRDMKDIQNDKETFRSNR